MLMIYKRAASKNDQRKPEVRLPKLELVKII